MAPHGYRTGTYAGFSDCAATDATWIVSFDDDDYSCDSTATVYPPLELVEWHEVEPQEDLREVFRGPHEDMIYKPPKRMVDLSPRFYKPPNYMSGRQIYKEKRKARLQL